MNQIHAGSTSRHDGVAYAITESPYSTAVTLDAGVIDVVTGQHLAVGVASSAAPWDPKPS